MMDYTNSVLRKEWLIAQKIFLEIRYIPDNEITLLSIATLQSRSEPVKDLSDAVAKRTVEQ